MKPVYFLVWIYSVILVIALTALTATPASPSTNPSHQVQYAATSSFGGARVSAPRSFSAPRSYSTPKTYLKPPSKPYVSPAPIIILGDHDDDDDYPRSSESTGVGKFFALLTAMAFLVVMAAALQHILYRRNRW